MQFLSVFLTFESQLMASEMKQKQQTVKKQFHLKAENELVNDSNCGPRICFVRARTNIAIKPPAGSDQEKDSFPRNPIKLNCIPLASDRIGWGGL